MVSLDNLRTVLNAIKRTLDSTKQDKLIAGENITIAADGKTISATGGGGGDDYITLNIRHDDSKVVLNEFQMPVIADKTVDEVMAEVNAGKKRVKIYMEEDPEPIIMNLSATYPVLSFALLVGGEEFGA